MSRRATCAECGEAIVFATTRNSKWVPILAADAHRLERLSGGALAFRSGGPTHFGWQCKAAVEERRRRQATPSPPTIDPIEAAFAVLGLRRDAPPVLINAAVRALAKLHHPDAGGDVARMQAINAARDVLERAGFLDERRTA